jgi:hypothetical protein
MVTNVRQWIVARLAHDFGIDESAVTDDFPWYEKMGDEDAGWFIYAINEQFGYIPSGFSFGSGDVPFEGLDAETFERIRTVGPMVALVEDHVKRTLAKSR